MNRPSRLKVDIESDVDSGRIVRVRKRTLSPEATYGDPRLLNQHVALDMLAGLCKQMLVWGCVETARLALCAEAETNGFVWSERYISSSILGKMLEELYMFHPGHRLLWKNLDRCVQLTSNSS